MRTVSLIWLMKAREAGGGPDAERVESVVVVVVLVGAWGLVIGRMAGEEEAIVRDWRKLNWIAMDL